MIFVHVFHILHVVHPCFILAFVFLHVSTLHYCLLLHVSFTMSFQDAQSGLRGPPTPRPAAASGDSETEEWPLEEFRQATGTGISGVFLKRKPVKKLFGQTNMSISISIIIIIHCVN